MICMIEQKVHVQYCTVIIVVQHLYLILFVGSFDLDISGNLRPSPVNGLSSHSGKRSKLAALQRSLHGKEVGVAT